MNSAWNILRVLEKEGLSKEIADCGFRIAEWMVQMLLLETEWQISHHGLRFVI
jgi:hypothetical protein